MIENVMAQLRQCTDLRLKIELFNAASTSPTPKFATAEARNSPMSLDKGYLTFVNGLKQEVLKLKEELDLMKMKIQTKEVSAIFFISSANIICRHKHMEPFIAQLLCDCFCVLRRPIQLPGACLV